MTYRATVGWNEAQLAGALAWLALGTGAATLEIYGTPQPQAAGGDAGETPLVVIPLQQPVGTIAVGVFTITPTEDAIITASGGAVWGRIRNGNGDIGFDAGVTDAQGAGPIKLPSTTLYAGGATRIVAGSTLGY